MDLFGGLSFYMAGWMVDLTRLPRSPGVVRAVTLRLRNACTAGRGSALASCSTARRHCTAGCFSAGSCAWDWR